MCRKTKKKQNGRRAAEIPESSTRSSTEGIDILIDAKTISSFLTVVMLAIS